MTRRFELDEAALVWRSPWVRAATVVSLAALNWAVNGHRYVDYLKGPVRFDAEVGRLAWSLVQDGSYANPFAALATGSSTHSPPGFPAFFATMIALFGTGETGWAAINIAGGLALSLWTALLPIVAGAVGLSPLAGVFAALGVTAATLHHFPEWDANYTALTLILLVLAAASPDTAHGSPARHFFPGGAPRSWRAVAGQGSLWALLFHLSATTLVLFVAWAVWIWMHEWRGRRAIGSRLVWATLVPLLALIPWTVRNWQAVGQPVVLRGNLGLELAVSNNDCASPGLLDNLETGCFGLTHPDLSIAEASRLRALGEPAYHSTRRSEALAWIGSHPARFLELTLARVRLFWFPTASDESTSWTTGAPPRRTRIIALATVASAVGWVMLGRSGVLFVSLLGLFPLVYYPMQFEDRYRYPILWATFLLAGHAVAASVAQLHRLHPFGRRDRRSA